MNLVDPSGNLSIRNIVSLTIQISALFNPAVGWGNAIGSIAVKTWAFSNIFSTGGNYMTQSQALGNQMAHTTDPWQMVYHQGEQRNLTAQAWVGIYNAAAGFAGFYPTLDYAPQSFV